MGDVEVLSITRIRLEPIPGPVGGLEPSSTIGPATDISRVSLADRLGSERCNGHSDAYIDHADTRLGHQTHIPTTTTFRSKSGSNGSAHIIDKDRGSHINPDGKTHADAANTLKDLEKNEDEPKRTRFRSLRASYTHASKKRKCINFTKKSISSPFGVMCLILMYLSLGACAFVWMERDMERTRRQELIDRRYDLTDTLKECQYDAEIGYKECLIKELKQWEKQVIKFPMLYIHLDSNSGQNSSEPMIWNWPNAFYGCFSIVTTIGYGTIAPVTSWGRLFAVVYAVIGIPLMLLLVADIGGQLARLVKIVIIALRKRRQTAIQSFRNNKKTRRTTADSTAQMIGSDFESPRRTRDDKYMSGRENLGLEYDGDDDVENVKNNVKNEKRRRKTTTTDYESDGSNSDDDDDHSDTANLTPSRKRKEYANGQGSREHPHEIRIEISDYDHDMMVDESDHEEDGNDSTTPGDTINDLHSDQHHDEDDDEDDANNHTDHNLYDDVVDGDLDYSSRLPESENQIKDCDSISQCSTNSSASETGTTGVTLDVPHKIKNVTLKLPNDMNADLNYADSAVSMSSSIHTTDSNTPTERFSRNKGLPRLKIIGRDTHREFVSVSTQTSRQKTTPPIIRIDKASDSDCSSVSSIFLEPNRTRLKRRPSVISSISVNMQQPHSVRIPAEYQGREAKRRTGVTFGASLGSFSNVTENDIALFSIPLWFALLLLLIYLLIGASCYTLMEGWSIIDSFYYAFISLSTVGFGDLYFVPESFEGALIFNFIYCFIGLSFVSMVWGLSSREFTLFARKIARNLGYYKSRRWRRTVKGWTSRMRNRSRRWSSRRRNGLKETNIKDSRHDRHTQTSIGSSAPSYSSGDEQ